jgi:stearoyl-CoA desaturase (Delta-9 desaturase)
MSAPPPATPVLEARPEPRGVVRLSARELRIQRRITLVLTVLPAIGIAAAVVEFWGRGIGGVDLAIMGAFYAFTGFGISVGYHRLFTHRSFTAARPARAVIAIAGSMAVQGSIISWVSTHRRHHAYADRFGDPHSPHLAQASGLKGVLLGLYHAHVGWLFDKDGTDRNEYAPDLVAEPMIARIDRLFPYLTLLTFFLPALLGLVITRSFSGMVTAFIWGSLVRIFALHHMTWSINSVCHFFGKEAYKARDESRNVWPMAVVSFGESWHNNHHAFPWSARLGLRAWEIDPGWYVIRTLQAFGLVRGVKVPTKAQRDARRISA